MAHTTSDHGSSAVTDAAQDRASGRLLPDQVDDASRRQIGWWLVLMAVLVGLMVVVGGATRLTDSGLSITEWKPVTGAIPPLSTQAWQAEFEKYKQIPEYELVNKGMSLAEFKTIFWWEWGHRFLGRFIGFAFLFPFIFFVLRRKVERSLTPKLLIMFVGGGAQGALGWFMVQSGLADRIDVSQYRLAAHLAAAFLIFAYILWIALDLLMPQLQSKRSDLLRLRNWAALLAVLVFVQVILGAFVAGLHAGLSYNTWPLMDGQIVPSGYMFQSPWYLNLFENIAAVQFNHRMAAYAATAVIVALVIMGRSKSLPTWVRQWLYVLLALVGVQVGLGIWTLLAVVPLGLALAHQVGALLLFAVSIVLAHSLFSLTAGHRQSTTA